MTRHKPTLSELCEQLYKEGFYIKTEEKTALGKPVYRFNPILLAISNHPELAKLKGRERYRKRYEKNLERRK